MELEATLTASEGEESDSSTETLLGSFENSESFPALEEELLEQDDVLNITIHGHEGDEPEDHQHDEHGSDSTTPSGYMSTVQEISPEEAIKMEKGIVFTDTLMQLITSLHGSACKRQGCGHVMEYHKTYVGTCLVVSWRCSAGHVGGRWAAQPFWKKLRAGNLLLASSLLLSGNSYAKVGLMFNFCKLQYFPSSLFYQYQGLFIIPAINEFWDEHQKKLWDEDLARTSN